MKNSSCLTAYEDGTVCSETSAYKLFIKTAYANETDSVPKRRHIKSSLKQPMKMEQSVPKRRHIKSSLKTAYENETYRVFRNVGIYNLHKNSL